MKTEDDIAQAVRTGEMTVTDAVTAAQGDDFVVYPAVGVAEGTEMWADVEDMGAGSTLFADLHKAGATSDQMDEIGAQIERARAEGRTLDKVYGWSTEAMTPEGTPAPPTLTALPSTPADTGVTDTGVTPAQTSG